MTVRAFGYIFAGERPGDFLFGSVSSAGDVDGDNKNDLLIGAPSAGTGVFDYASGSTYLIAAADLVTLDRADGSRDGVIDLGRVAAIGTSYKIIGENSSDNSGSSVSSAGDVDGDGKDDLLIGAHNASEDGPYSGAAYLITVADLVTLDGADGSTDGVVDLGRVAATGASYKFKGENRYERAGHSVSSAGDVDGDGKDDLLIGAHKANPEGGRWSGSTYLVTAADLAALDGEDGSPDGVIDLGWVAPIGASYEFIGENRYDESGMSVSLAGDVDGDGKGDLLIGAPYADPNGNRSGSAYLINAADLATLDAADDSSDGMINLGRVASIGTSYKFSGETAGYETGWSVSLAGDVDEDGKDDLLIGTNLANVTYLINAADLAALDDADGNPDGVIDLGHVASIETSYKFIGAKSGGFAGLPVSLAGDVDGDGKDDLLVGAPYASEGGPNSDSTFLINAVDLATLDRADGDPDGVIQLENLIEPNEPPVAVDDSGPGFATQADAAFTTGDVLANDSDPEGDTPTVSGLDTTGTRGTVTDNGDGTFLYDPAGAFDALAEGANATDVFGYRVTDGREEGDTATVTIAVTGVNDAPVFDPDFAGSGGGLRTLPENSANGTQVATAVAVDPDGDGITYSIASGNADADGDGLAAFAIDPASGKITVNDSGDLDYEVTDSVTLEIRAADPKGLSDNASLKVSLTDVAEPGNDRPEVQDADFGIPEGSLLGEALGRIMATDSDAGDTLTYAINAGNGDADGDGLAAFAINPVTGEITVADSDDLDFETSPVFTLEIAAEDGSGFRDSAEATIDLIDLNEVDGTERSDDLTGSNGADLIIGQDGDDTLEGSDGNDILQGGAGTDWVSEEGDVDFVLTPTQLTGLGTDRLDSIERADLTGGAGDNRLDAGGFANGLVKLDGGGGNDTLISPDATGAAATPGARFDSANILTGGDGDDVFTGSTGFDMIVEQVRPNSTHRFILGAGQMTGIRVIVNDIDAGGTGDDSFTGIEAVYLTGGNWHDQFDASGFEGAFTFLRGEMGNDLLIGGRALDVAIAAADKDFLLTDTRLTGHGVDTLKEIDQARLVGGRSDNIFDVSASSMARVTMKGSGGDDTFIGRGDLDDWVIEKGDVDFSFADGTLVGLGTDTLRDIDTVQLWGGPGANVFDFSGFTGKLAIAVVNGGGDTVIGHAGGIDRVNLRGDFDMVLTDTQLVGEDTVTLDGVEQAVLTSAHGDDTLDASAFTMGHVRLTGGAGDDILRGGTRNDILSGGSGENSLFGGLGNDRVYSEGDVDMTLTATRLVGIGTDTLDSIEEAHLKGSVGDNRLDASAFTGTLVLLEGQGGDDTLIGRVTGRDVVRAVGDADFKLTDTALVGLGSDTLTDIDEARLSGHSGSNIFDASEFTRGPVQIRAGAGDDVLVGGSAADDLEGGRGADIYWFLDAAHGPDSFHFEAGADTIRLDADGFAGLPLGVLAPERLLQASADPAHGDAVLLYDGTTGELFFDADGNGADAPVLFAIDPAAPTLTASDFIIDEFVF